MADNTTLNTGTGGDVIATDDIGGVKHQQVKVEWGIDGTATPVSAANPMPVVQTGTHAVNATLTAETTKVIGTVNISAAQTVATVTTVGAVTAITNALPAGTNAIGKLSANSGVDIGDVDVTTVGTITPGTAATSLGKAEDAAHTSGDVGVMSLGVRRDANTTLAGTDGDYAPYQLDANGSVKVAITAGAGSGGTSIADGASFTRDTTSITPVGAIVETSAPTLTNGDAAGLSMTTGGALRVAVASGGVSGVVDDAAVTPGTTEGLMFMAEFDDTSPDSVDEGDGGMLRMSANRNLYGTIRDAAGNERGANVNSSNALLTAQTGAIPAGTNNIGDVDVLTVPADPFGANADASSATGSISAKLRFIASTGIPVTGTVTVGSHAVTNAGTFVTQENGALLTAAQLIDDTIIADDAAFTVGTTKVNVIGHLADETATDSVDEGDVGASRMTLDRKLIVTPYAHAAAGGCTPYFNLDCDETEDDIKTSAGKLFWIHVINLTASKRYIKFYNDTAANVTVGTTTPALSFPVPTMADTNGAGFTISFGPQGTQFTTAISVAATTGFANNDTGAPGTNDVILNAGYI